MTRTNPQLITGLIFAVIQTAAALAQYIQVSSWCSPRVTGVFNLTAGFWFQGGNVFRLGRNFRRERNGYVDYEVVRVVKGEVGERVERREVKVLPTVLTRSIASDMLAPLTFAWKLAVRYKAGSAPRMSSAPGLEVAAWCQFLMNFQDVW
ncbi:hypothetical protein C8A05DRAFT_36661 [Staphylotrichum tortipilum]|uniref:Secreted protein n=1 Tax=Staphylotrichum tortipilum TaxID=2831512 RepID=A0AAN6MGW1_9PEZI|nr:hypothetical protein C8A05DRAFT_36661 [Staphylotrichum longicolle]